jgi:hypothetical protein
MNDNRYDVLLKTCSQHLGYISKIVRKNLNIEFAVKKDRAAIYRLDSEIETWQNEVEAEDQIRNGLEILNGWKAQSQEQHFHPFYSLFFVRAKQGELDTVCSIYDSTNSAKINHYIGFPFCDDVVLYGGNTKVINQICPK